MRHITARRVAILALVVACSMAMAASAPAATPLNLEPKPMSEHSVVIRGGEYGKAGRMWGYWGVLVLHSDTPSPSPPPRVARYRATCTWVADKYWNFNKPKLRDSRLLCTVVLSFVSPSTSQIGSDLVAQGIIRRPRRDHGLFEDANRRGTAKDTGAPRQLAITGGTVSYPGARGYIDLSTSGELLVWIA